MLRFVCELQDGTIDKSEIIEIEAGDVDPRLAGCGALPPAVLSALTLWKGGVINTTGIDQEGCPIHTANCKSYRIKCRELGVLEPI